MNRQVSKFALVAAMLIVSVPGVAQDEQRVNEILRFAELRARDESDSTFGLGDFPKAIQQQKMRLEIRPWDENLTTDLIWMLGNVENNADALVVAKRFKEFNSKNPDRGYPEALLYSQWKMFAKVPPVLERDIAMVPPPHRNSFSLLSSAYNRLGRHADALRVLEMALKHYPEDALFKRNRDREAELVKGGG